MKEYGQAPRECGPTLEAYEHAFGAYTPTLEAYPLKFGAYGPILEAYEHAVEAYGQTLEAEAYARIFEVYAQAFVASYPEEKATEVGREKHVAK